MKNGGEIKDFVKNLAEKYGKKLVEGSADLGKREKCLLDDFIKNCPKELNGVLNDYGISLFDLDLKRYLGVIDELGFKSILKKAQMVINGARISDLSASLIGEEIEVDVQIVGQQQKVLLRKLVVRCKKCNACHEVDLSRLENGKILMPLLSRKKNIRNELGPILEGMGECDDGEHSIFYTEEGNMDHYIIYARDIIENVEKFDERVYESRTIHLIGASIPSAKKVTIKGKVMVDPKNMEICILANEIVPYENEISNFKITERDKENFAKYFGESDISFQIAPDMVGREIVQKSRLLTIHSLHTIPDINGKVIRGSVREILFGDSKTYKSESEKDVTNHYKLGDYVVAESSSRPGLTYSIDMERGALIWGALPLNDLGYIGLDGLHSLSAEELKEMRESLENQRIIVRRFKSGEAMARVRITACLNPNHPMNEYLYPCMAIMDNRAFYEAPDVTRWDIFLPFAEDDVKEELIVERETKERPIPDDVFKRHIYWAWSRRPNQVEYSPRAKERIVEESKRIMKSYKTSSIPIVHLGFRDVLCRLSVAMAALRNSTDDENEKVIVKEQHVEGAVNFYEEMLELLQLQEYKLQHEGKLKITDYEFAEISSNLEPRQIEILEKISMEYLPASKLADDFDVSETTIKRDYDDLRKYDLIETKPGKGAKANVRGIKLLKKLMGVNGKLVSSYQKMIRNGEIVSKNDTMIRMKQILNNKIDKFTTLDNEDIDWIIGEILTHPGMPKYILRQRFHEYWVSKGRDPNQYKPDEVERVYDIVQREIEKRNATT